MDDPDEQEPAGRTRAAETPLVDTSEQMLSILKVDFQRPPEAIPEQTSSARAASPDIAPLAASAAVTSMVAWPELLTSTSTAGVEGSASATAAVVLAMLTMVTMSLVAPKMCGRVWESVPSE